MNRFIKAAMMFAIVFLIMFGTAACSNGGSILTRVTLEDNFQGTRVMEVSIEKSTFDQYFKGTVDDLKSLVMASCPQQLSYEVNETDSNIVCVFRLEFDSIDTYKDKVAAIIGEEREIEALKSDSFLVQGITYEENFTSRELLSWLSDALVDNNYVSSENKSKILESDRTTFVFSSMEYDSGEQIYVSDIQYLPFGVIDILTKPYFDNTYDRTVIFHIPQYTMDQKGEEITAYLEEGVPGNAEMAWDTNRDNDETVFRITMKKLDAGGLNSAMRSIFHSDLASVEKTSYTYEKNMLEHGMAFKETVDASKFISNQYAQAHVRYYVDSSLLSYIEDSEWGQLWDYGYGQDDYYGYKCVYDYEITDATLTVSFKYSFYPDSISVLTQVHGKDKIQRDIDLIYESEEEKDGTALLRDNIGDAIEGYAEMEYIEQDGGFVIKIKQKGTKEEVNTGFQAIFNSPASYMRYARQGNKTQPKLTSVFEENLDFRSLLAGDIPIYYEAKLSRGEKISETTYAYYSDNDDLLAIKDDSIKMEFNGGRVNCSVVTTKFNVFFLLYLLLILIFAAALLIAVIMLILMLKEKRRELKAEGRRSTVQFSESTLDVMNKKRCTVCGSDLDWNVKFCTKCGARLDENNDQGGV